MDCWKNIFARVMAVLGGSLTLALVLPSLIAIPAAHAQQPPAGFALPPPLNVGSAVAGSATPIKPAAPQPDPSAPAEVSLNCPARFITALCADLDGNIYAATEDQGIWRWIPPQNAKKFPAIIHPSALPPPLLINDPLHALGHEPPPQGRWEQFAIDDGLSDTCYYALACDKLGRMWAGTLRHGVDVYNGKTWQNYNVIAGLPREGQSDSDPHASLAGPLGARVFAIATCPTDGDIWISTEAGLSRYSLEAEKRETRNMNRETDDGTPHSSFSIHNSSFPLWSYYTRGGSTVESSSVAEARGSSGVAVQNSLPSDQASCLAFNHQGDIFVGTQCDGIAIARASENYKNWKVIHGPEKLPLTATGPGLPTDLINALLVVEPTSLLPTSNSQLPSSSPATIFAATDAGLAYSTDNGLTWSYTRGQDYADKVRGLYGGPPKGWTDQSRSGVPPLSQSLLTEDYITNLAQDAQGRIWLCHRQTGYEVFNPHSNSQLPTSTFSLTRIFSSTQDPKLSKLDGYISAVLPTSNFQLHTSPVLLARYGSGISQFNFPTLFSGAMATSQRDHASSSHPITPPPPQPVTDSSLPPNTYLDAQDSLRYNVVPTPSPRNSDTPLQPSNSQLRSSQFPPLPLAAKPPTVDELQALLAKMQSQPKTNILAAFLGDDYLTQGDWTCRYGRQYAVLCAACWPLDDQFSHGDKYYRVESGMDPHFEKHDSLRRWLHWASSENPKVLYDPFLGHRRQAEWDDHGEAYNQNVEGPNICITVTIPSGIHRVSLYFFNKDGHNSVQALRDYLITVKQAGRTFVETEALPIIARARVNQFWGGIYKQFALRGPGRYSLNVERNNSFNTTCSAVFMDRLAGQKAEFDDLACPSLEYITYEAPNIPLAFSTSENPIWKSSRLIWERIAASSAMMNPAMTGYRFLAYRAAIASNAPESALANWRWQACLWTQNDRDEFTAKMAEGWRKFLERNPAYLAFVTQQEKS